MEDNMVEIVTRCTFAGFCAAINPHQLAFVIAQLTFAFVYINLRKASVAVPAPPSNMRVTDRGYTYLVATFEPSRSDADGYEAECVPRGQDKTTVMATITGVGSINARKVELGLSLFIARNLKVF